MLTSGARLRRSRRRYQGVSESAAVARSALSRDCRPPHARLLSSQLSTIELTDADRASQRSTTPAVCDIAGRAECGPSRHWTQDVTDGSLEQSATAVLDKISGADLIGARQRQAERALIGCVEQLVVDTKRERDTHAAALNMQLLTWRTRSVNEPTRRRGWRSPPHVAATLSRECHHADPAITRSDSDDSAGDHAACC